MPIILKKEFENASLLGLWKIEESEEYLLELLSKKYNKNDFNILQQSLNQYSNPHRRREWLVVRVLLYELINKAVLIIYDEFRKPFLADNSLCISVSHKDDLVGILLGNNKNIGLDIEKITPRIEKIAHKFINKTEKDYLLENIKTEQLTMIWSAKEVLYKIHGVGNLDFIKNLNINSFVPSETDNVSASIAIKNHNKEFLLQYFKFENFFVVFSVYD